MQLESVRALKQELLSVPGSLVTHVASTRSFRVFSSRRETTDRVMTRVALGVAPGRKNQYRLAVRQQPVPQLNNLIKQTVA